MKELKGLLIIIIASNFFSNLYAQKLEQSLSFADNMFSENKIDLALKEYLRVYYLDKENNYARVSDNISICFLNKNDIPNAIKYQDLYYFKLKANDPLRNEIRYKKQMIYLISAEYNKALVEILQVNKRSNFNNDRHQFLLSINYLLSNEFDKAKNEISKITYYSKLDTNQLNLAFKNLIKNNKKNPKNARWLSTIVPGLGQMANGEVKDGLNSFGLYAGFIAIWIDLTKSIGFADATMSVGPWILRYYLGGLNNSIEASKKKKHNNKQKQIDSLITIIEKGKLN